MHQRSRRIAVVGHSRLGKTALLSAAFDERIALAIPHKGGGTHAPVTPEKAASRPKHAV
jgi:predicted YcjX-like family ATPase